MFLWWTSMILGTCTWIWLWHLDQKDHFPRGWQWTALLRGSSLFCRRPRAHTVHHSQVWAAGPVQALNVGRAQGQAQKAGPLLPNGSDGTCLLLFVSSCVKWWGLCNWKAEEEGLTVAWVSWEVFTDRTLKHKGVQWGLAGRKAGIPGQKKNGGIKGRRRQGVWWPVGIQA